MRKAPPWHGIVWYLVSILILLVMLFPIYWMFMVSLKLPEEIFASPPVCSTPPGRSRS